MAKKATAPKRAKANPDPGLGPDEISRLLRSPKDEDQVTAVRALAPLTDEERAAFLFGAVRNASPDKLIEATGTKTEAQARKLVAAATKKLGG